MFKDAKAFSSFSVENIQKAKQFYSETLGLQVKDDPMGLLDIQLATGGTVMIYPKDNHTPASFTVLNFLVENIEEAVDELKSRGVRFESYNTGQIKTDEKGIARGRTSGQGPDIAWFKIPQEIFYLSFKNGNQVL